MFKRILSPIKSNSFFIFGPRGTGKTTFLKDIFVQEKILWIDLLDPALEDRYSRSPETLNYEIQAKKDQINWIVIDEVQRVPKLLNLVHYYIENSNLRFAITGSSARKLKKDSANLLAGRAFVNYLFPLTSMEMGNSFHLDHALQWGTLPKATQLKTGEEKNAFLRSYALTYLKEEVWAEHIIRQLDPFRRFLEIAAQTNGQILNYANIAQDVGVDIKTVQFYFEILEDTLMGILLESFHYSVRKRQRKNPKFYFFDLGLKRALERMLQQPLVPNSYSYGTAFEHFVIMEIYRLSMYYQKDFRFSYLRTKDDAEIDLILERPGRPLALIEIKSTTQVDRRDVSTVEHFLKDFKKAEGFCLSRDPHPQKIGNVHAMPWFAGLTTILSK